MAFRRFIAIRGTPAVVFADNGTNLVAGESEIRAGMDSLTRKASKCPNKEVECDCNLDHKKVAEEMARRRLAGRFSPPPLVSTLLRWMGKDSKIKQEGSANSITR
jgi:hypothetical protein